MNRTMSDPLIPSTFTESDEFKEFALERADQYPQAFKLLPKGQAPEDAAGAWAPYEFDGVVVLWIDTSHPESIVFYRDHFKQEKVKAMTTALTVQESKQVKILLRDNLHAIKSVLPKHLPPEKMARLAYTAVVKTPELARCSQISLFNAILEAASIGLEIGGPLGFAHLVPFKKKVTLIIDYKGLIELAYKSPKVKAFTAQPVYENDEFTYNYGLHKDLSHRPAPGPKGKLTHAYAIVEFMGGGFDMEVATQADAMAAKENSPAKNKTDSPWNVPKHEWTMWVKTAVRKLMKRIPKTPEMQRAMNMDENPEAKTDNFIDVDFTTVKELNGKTVTGEDIPPDEGAPPEEKPNAGAGGNGGSASALTEMEEKILANLEVCKSDSVLSEMYEATCKKMNLDPAADHSPEVAEQILNAMRE